MLKESAKFKKNKLSIFNLTKLYNQGLMEINHPNCIDKKEWHQKAKGPSELTEAIAPTGNSQSTCYKDTTTKMKDKEGN